MTYNGLILCSIMYTFYIMSYSIRVNGEGLRQLYIKFYFILTFLI
jgi:hypothetical protein